MDTETQFRLARRVFHAIGPLDKRKIVRLRDNARGALREEEFLQGCRSIANLQGNRSRKATPSIGAIGESNAPAVRKRRQKRGGGEIGAGVNTPCTARWCDDIGQNMLAAVNDDRLTIEERGPAEGC